MLHVDRIADLRGACEQARAAGRRVGLVPTMGYLHDGHRSLMRAARAATDFVVVTIFVNPLQFGPHEDLDRYPRDLAGDLAACEAEGVDCVFTPSVPKLPLTIGDRAKPDPGVANAGAESTDAISNEEATVNRTVRFIGVLLSLGV